MSPRCCSRSHYGGLPLKIIWAVLDVVTIIVLASGLYLRRKRLRQSGENAALDQRSRAPEAVRGSRRDDVRWWPIPAALAVTSVAGLIGAPLAEGAGDVASCLALGGVTATAALVFFPRRPDSPPATATPRSD